MTGYKNDSASASTGDSSIYCYGMLKSAVTKAVIHWYVTRHFMDLIGGIDRVCH
jgi:hypothetical protein